MTFKVHVFLIISAIGILSVFGCNKSSSQISALPQEVSIENDRNLKQSCIAAAMCGIELDIKRHQDWISQRKEKSADDSGINEIQECLSQLNTDLGKF